MKNKIFLVVMAGALLLSMNVMPQQTATGHAVDLGLSVNWSDCNIGAIEPDDYGSVFSWEEFEKELYPEWLTNYPSNAAYVNISATKHDFATIKWGGDWRLPTRDECLELLEKCQWRWMSENGVYGMKVVGPNGNSIFLPASGYRKGKLILDQGKYGHYWSGTLTNDYGHYSFEMCFANNGNYWAFNHRNWSIGAIRPVKVSTN